MEDQIIQKIGSGLPVAILLGMDNLDPVNL